jgi:hypothetical protein
MIDHSCLHTQKVRFTCAPDAPIDGAVRAVIDSGDAVVEAGNGPLDIVVRPADGTVQDVTGRLQGDADPSVNENLLEEPFVIHVASPQATTLGASAANEPK